MVCDAGAVDGLGFRVEGMAVVVSMSKDPAICANQNPQTENRTRDIACFECRGPTFLQAIPGSKAGKQDRCSRLNNETRVS